MIQRLFDIKNDATAAFEKESKLLLVRIDTDTLTFVLQDKDSGTWEALEILGLDKPENWNSEKLLAEVKRNSSLVSYTGLATRVFISTPQAMPFPQKFSTDAALFFETQFGQVEGQLPETEVINEEIAVAFLSPQPDTVIARLFPRAKWNSTLALLIKQVLGAAEATALPLLFLHLSSGQAEMALAADGKLLLARCFDFIVFEDVLYHLLNTCRQLQIGPEAVHIYVQGRVTEQGREMTLLKTYFAQVAFATTKSGNPITASQQVPAHYFTGLMEKI